MEERIKKWLEERNQEIEEERREIAEVLLSKVWDFQEKFPKKSVRGFILRNNDGYFEIVILLKDSINEGFSAGGEKYQTPVLKHVKEILESCGVNCSDVEVGRVFEAYY